MWRRATNSGGYITISQAETIVSVNRGWLIRKTRFVERAKEPVDPGKSSFGFPTWTSRKLFHACVRNWTIQLRTGSVFEGLSLLCEPNAISDLRDAADGPSDKGRGLGRKSEHHSDRCKRTTRKVLNIAYLGTNASSGGFFPNGPNGEIR